MDTFSVYKDIQARTDGQLLAGVVGPVRTGKSTFIRRFMEVFALPSLKEEQQTEIKDTLPVSGSGKLITTVEPKFIPREAIPVTLGEEISVKLRLIDCVGYLIPEASGNLEDGRERMVKTPWFDHEIPFHQAAELGTRKVIRDHSTIGFLVTCDGSFGEIPRENYVSSEERTVKELKETGKPFLIILNSQKPFKEETRQLAKQLQEKYQVSVLPVNCEQLRKDDVIRILEKILYEFPIRQLEFYIPKWVELLPVAHPLKADLITHIRAMMQQYRFVRDVCQKAPAMDSEYVSKMEMKKVDLSTGVIQIQLEINEKYYYDMLSEMTGVDIEGEYQLIHILKEMSVMKNEYQKVQNAISSVRGCGYGVVVPEKEEIELEEPSLIRQGNKFGVKIKSISPSIHMIKANIETEIAPIVGSEEQAKDLISYIKENASEENGIWQTNIFGKSIEQLVEDGIRTKIAQISEESQIKLQDTMQKIVNDSKGGLVCIII